jgi:hydroxypyruvate isomerase
MDVPLPQRIMKAAELGFRVVEVWSPYLDPIDEIVKAKQATGVEIVQFNMDRIDLKAGERGNLSLPENQSRFRADLELAIQTAQTLGAKRFNALIGNISEQASRDEQLECMKENLRWAQPLLEKNNLTLVTEPACLQLNPRYFMPRPSELFTLLRELNLPNVKVQYDMFHAQMAEGNLIGTIKDHAALIANIQIADAPGRNQPGTGEINYRRVFSAIESFAYDGRIALEFIPAGSIEEALAWLPRECRVECESGALKL